MPVFVKFYGSLMVHGYGSEKSRVVTARFNRGLTAVMYRGFETVKSPEFFAASLANRQSSVLWVSPTVLMCAGMWSSRAAGGFTLTAALTNMSSL